MKSILSTLIIIPSLSALVSLAAAQDHGHGEHDNHDHQHAHGDEQSSAKATAIKEGRTIKVAVNGMVCDFCAQSLTKVLKKNDNVEEVAISLEDKTVTIVLAEGGAMDDAEVEKSVKKAGYNMASLERL